MPGILHERSNSGASFFIEPIQSIELNNDLADLLIQEREEIARITRYVSQMLFDSAEDIRAAIDAGGEIDGLQACAIFADTVRATRPISAATGASSGGWPPSPCSMSDWPRARQEAFGKEPSDRRVIPISVHLDGKAPALIVVVRMRAEKPLPSRTAGLLIAMEMSGMPVPAAEGTILPLVDGLHVVIGDDQSVVEHLVGDYGPPITVADRSY